MHETGNQRPAAPTINRAIALHQQGRLEDAETCYKEILKSQPQHADTIHLLGVIQQQKGKPEAAIELIQKALQINPDNAVYLNNLGSAFLSCGNFDNAANCFQRALSTAPNYPDAIQNLGDIYRKLGKLKDALGCYQQLLAIGPNNYFSHLCIANTYQQLGKKTAAQKHYETAQALAPTSPEVLKQYAIFLSRNGQISKAITLFEKILTEHPSEDSIHRNLGSAHLLNGDLEKAEHYLQKALAHNPDDFSALAQLAVIKGYQGEPDTAESLCRQVLEKDPNSIQALCTLADISRIDNEANFIAQLESIVQDPKTANIDKISLNFHLGSLYEKQHQYDIAFDRYTQSNNVRSLLYGEHDLRETERRYNLIIDTFDQAFFAHQEASGSDSSRPIFIIGMPRSGTTLTEQILASHSQVYGAGELRHIKQYANIFTANGDEGQFKKAMTGINQEMLTNLASDYLSKLAKLSADKVKIADKMPHNYEAVWLIRLLFPNAKIIHCQRNPLDTCLSCYFTNFSKGHYYKHNLETLGKYYCLYQKLMNHWMTTLPSSTFFSIQYEALIKDPQHWIPKLLSYCELEPEAACLQFYKSNRVVKTASFNQVRQKLYSKSVDRWRHYEEFIKPLETALNI